MPRREELWNRKIFTNTTERNGSLKFPYVGQALASERQGIEKKTRKVSIETVYALTNHAPESASAARLPALNRGH